MAAAETVELLLQPFEGEQRAGEDPRREEEFEAIGLELAKIGGVEQQVPDWPAVVEWSEKLLRETGKDLRCAVYWCMGRVCAIGPETIGDGVLLLRRILEEFKGDCHPLRPRARAAIFAWLAERADVELAMGTLALTQDELSAIRGDLNQCALILGELDLDTAPFRRLGSAIETNVSMTLSPEEQVAAVRSRFDPDFADLALTMLAHPGVEKNTALGLRIRRFVCWASPPPSRDLSYACSIAVGHADALRTLFEDKEWGELLAESESLFLTSPFWLDLTFYTAHAAERVLGDPAAAGVIASLRDLLARAPGLPEGLDEAGAPLASEDVREWIEAEVKDAQAAKGSTAVAELPPEIRSHLEEGRLRDALAEASPWLAHPDGRIRFARSVALAKAFAARGSAPNAHIVFRGLHNHLRQMTVKEWDPPIFTACIEGYLATKRDAFGLGPEDEPLMDELSALDPAALMSILPA